MFEMKRCANCGAILTIRDREGPAKFRKRKTCGSICANALLHDSSKSKLPAQGREDWWVEIRPWPDGVYFY